MISRSAGYKIHFRKQPPFRGNICPLIVGVISFVSLNIYAPVKTFTLTIEGISAISLSSQKPRCFNNVIPHLNEINKIKNAVVIRIILASLRPSFSDEPGNLLCQRT